MTINEIITNAAEAYPEVLEAWNPAKGKPIKNAGDTLALFVVQELSDTFDDDPKATDEKQLEAAAHAMERAASELAAVAKVMTAKRKEPA